MTELHNEDYTILGTRLGEENPLPFFRDPAINTDVQAFDSLPAEKREFMGWETAFRVLPYRMQDQYTRRREPLTFRAIVLENEYLKATFLPEVGGRLVSLFYKPENRELLHVNPVFQPANLAIRNAWFSGGIEWNIGQFGHTFTTCAPVFAGAIRGSQGEPGLRLYEFERCKRLFWQIDLTLPPGLPFLVAYMRVINLNPEPTSMYWWTNTAVNERPGVRVLAPAAQALYGAFEAGGTAFGQTDLPGLPSLNGADGTYSLHSTFANEFFFQCDAASMPWEAALDEYGCGFIEASTPRLKYRKLFCWGTHAGGRHWQEYLAQLGEAYLEIQAGLAPTQVHGLPMPAQTAWDWTQVFGYIESDPNAAHSPDWQTAWRSVDRSLRTKLPESNLLQLEQGCRSRADLPSEAILNGGSGWGALELRLRAQTPSAQPVPAAFAFPDETLGVEQKKWLALLEHGSLPEQPAGDLPGEWMVQPDWEALLAQSLKKDGGWNWYALLHLGVMRMERGDTSGAEAAWASSLALQPSAWAYRNLALLKLRQGDAQAAFRFYEQAWQAAAETSTPPAGLAVEFLQKLFEAGQFERGAQVYQSLPIALQDVERIQILRGQFALALDDLDAVEQVLEREYAAVREGETVLSDLWTEVHARREAARTGRVLDEDLRKSVRTLYPPPARIDFRSFNE
jgi:tetratricopeptide (TPR) repeat protein